MFRENLRNAILWSLRTLIAPQTLNEIRFNIGREYDECSTQFIKGNIQELIKQGKVKKTYYRKRAMYEIATRY